MKFASVSFPQKKKDKRGDGMENDCLHNIGAY